MKCDEVQSLQGAYLDSELEAAMSLQIEQHLKSCPDCARHFAGEQRLEAWLKAGLNRGQRTASLWEKAEQAVLEAARANARTPSESGFGQDGPGVRAILALFGRLRAGWSGSPKAWSALAATWIIILTLHFTAREGSLARGPQNAPSASELREAFEQKQKLMNDLAAVSEPAPAVKPKTTAASPRSSLNISYERKT